MAENGTILAATPGRQPLSGGVPVTINWGILYPQQIAIEDRLSAPDHWSGDFIQNDCLAVAGNYFPDVTFSRPVSQFGFQIEYGPISRQGTITAKDCTGNTLFTTNYMIPGNSRKQDGSAPYVGVENTSGSPTICEVIYGYATEDYAINEPSITVPNDPACYTPPNTTMVAWYPFDEPSPVPTSANLASANAGKQYGLNTTWRVIQHKIRLSVSVGLGSERYNWCYSRRCRAQTSPVMVSTSKLSRFPSCQNQPSDPRTPSVQQKTSRALHMYLTQPGSRRCSFGTSLKRHYECQP